MKKVNAEFIRKIVRKRVAEQAQKNKKEQMPFKRA
jgi:hypothetical protein